MPIVGSPFRVCVMAPLLAALIEVGGPCAAAPVPSPAVQMVAAFYKRHLKTDMGFTESSLRAKRQWLSTELYGLLLYERRRPIPRDKVPYLDGDPFTDAQDLPNGFHIGKVTQHGPTAVIEVVFEWGERNKVITKTTCRVATEKMKGRWRITDIVGSDGQSLAANLANLKRKDLASRRK